MIQTKPMKILILEDSEYEINRFKNAITKRSEVELIAATNSSIDALDFVKINNIEGIIVDIELKDGLGGTGLDFLSELNSLKIDIRPLVIVTTKIPSDRVHNAARKLGADLIFYKSQKDYSPDIVLNNFLLLRESLHESTPESLISETYIETKENYKARLEKRINAELDNVGMAYHLKGRKYIFDAVYFLITTEDKDAYYLSYLTEKHKKVNSSINNAIQHSINSAWSSTPYEELEKHFPAKMTFKNGVPKPSQFIYHIVNKIKQSLN